MELDLFDDGFGKFANSKGVDGTIGDEVIGLLDDMLGIELEDSFADVLEFNSGSVGIDNDKVVLLLSVEFDSMALLLPLDKESDGCLKRRGGAGGFDEDNIGEPDIDGVPEEDKL